MLSVSFSPFWTSIVFYSICLSIWVCLHTCIKDLCFLVYVCAQRNSIFKKMVTNHISLFSADFIPSFCSIFGSSVYFLGHKTRNKILYPMMLLALRSPHLEGTVIFGHLQSFWSLFHPSAAGAPTPFLGLSRRSADSSCIRSLGKTASRVVRRAILKTQLPARQCRWRGTDPVVWRPAWLQMGVTHRMAAKQLIKNGD